MREHKGWLWVGVGLIALGINGFVATLQPAANFGRILAAYGGVFVAGSLLWGMVADGFKPDRYDVAGALVCLVGVALIMYAPREVRHSQGHLRLRRACRSSLGGTPGLGVGFVPDLTADWHVFAGDLSALPAIAAALEPFPSAALDRALGDQRSEGHHRPGELLLGPGELANQPRPV